MKPPQTCLVTPRMNDAAAFRPLLAATIVRYGAVSVLLRFAAGGERETLDRAKTLVLAAQEAGAAALVENDPGLAVRAGADGVHAGDPAALRVAVERLKPERIVGAGGLATRHAAMEAGEAGADYVMFGEPASGWDSGEILPPFPAVLERAAWWAHLFETPCIVYAPSAEAVGAVGSTGAEFVALGPWAFA